MKKFILALFMLISTTSWATVPSATPLKNTYSCNSSTTQWSYGFPISAPSDMTVYVTDSTGTTTQILTNFTVDTNNLWVVYPVTGSACPTGSQVTLIPSTPQTQLLSLTSRSPFVATAIGGALDKLTLISQQLQGQLNRTILGPVNSSGTTTLPSPSDGKVIGWSGGSLVNFVPNTNTYITTSTDGTFASNSDSLIPTQKATKTYVDTGLATKVSAGANSSITSLTGLSTPLSTSQGGTGATASANAANGVVILNSSGALPSLNGTIPIGGIIFWSGTIATIPSGWALCNGANGTPDLRNEFIVGANADSGGVAKSTITGSALQSGGSTTIAQANLPSYNLSFTRYDGNGSGSTGVQGTTNGASPSSQTVSSGGSGTAYTQPFYALAYIQRIS